MTETITGLRSLIMFPRTQRSAKFTNYYSGPNGGHFAYEKTNEKLKNRFDWPGMK